MNATFIQTGGYQRRAVCHEEARPAFPGLQNRGLFTTRIVVSSDGAPSPTCRRQPARSACTIESGGDRHRREQTTAPGQAQHAVDLDENLRRHAPRLHEARERGHHHGLLDAAGITVARDVARGDPQRPPAPDTPPPPTPPPPASSCTKPWGPPPASVARIVFTESSRPGTTGGRSGSSESCMRERRSISYFTRRSDSRRLT